MIRSRIVRVSLRAVQLLLGLAGSQRLAMNVFYGPSSPTRVGRYAIAIDGWLLLGLFLLAFGLVQALLARKGASTFW